MEAPPLFTHASLLLNSQFIVAPPITSHSHSLLRVLQSKSDT